MCIIRRRIIDKLERGTGLEEEDLISAVADDLQTDVEDVRGVIEEALDEGSLVKIESRIFLKGGHPPQ